MSMLGFQQDANQSCIANSKVTRDLSPQMFIHQKQLGFRLDRQPNRLSLSRIQFQSQCLHEASIRNRLHFDPATRLDLIRAWLPYSVDHDFLPYRFWDSQFTVKFVQQIQFADPRQVD